MSVAGGKGDCMARDPAEPRDPSGDRENKDLARLSRVRESRAAACNPAARRYGIGLREWYDDLPLERKRELGALEARAERAATEAGANVPLRFRLLELGGVGDAARHRLLKKADMLAAMNDDNGEHYKLASYLEAVCALPLGKRLAPALPPAEPARDAGAYLEGVRARLDAAVSGLDATKDAVLRIVARWIAAPASLAGAVLGLVGPPGVGKTTVAKALAEAVGLPLAFVPLGGAQDGAHLDGHALAYEGSTPGKVAEALARARCMNPVLVLDEVDKVSDTPKGREIVGILTHMTDPSQNAHFTDKYFSDVDLDLGGCVFVFTMNDEAAVSPVLRDRMTMLRIEGYGRAEKTRIVREHVLPKVLRDHGLEGRLVMPDAALEAVMDVCPAPGVRDAKRCVEAVVGSLNLRRFREGADGDLKPVSRDDVRRHAPTDQIERGPPPGMYI